MSEKETVATLWSSISAAASVPSGQEDFSNCYVKSSIQGEAYQAAQ